MPLAHRHTPADVQGLLDRYKQLTGDYEATITLSGHSWHHFKGELKLPPIEGRKCFCIALEALCAGYEAGYKTAFKED